MQVAGRGHWFAASLVAWLGLLGCARHDGAPQGPAGEPVTVQIGYQKSGAPFLLKTRAAALEARLQKLGARLKWIEFQAGPPILEAMRVGAVDIGHTGETPPVFAQAGGVPFVYAASDPPSPQAEAIVVRHPSLQKLGDLKGKRIALNRGSNVHYLLLQALKSAGLTVDDVQTIYLAPPDARSAFENGTVDAWVIWDPFLAAAELEGARVLATAEGLCENRYYYVARRAFAEQHPQLLDAVLDEFATLSSWARDHDQEAARLLSDASGISHEALLRSERRHVYGLTPVDDAILAKQQTIADAFFALRLIPQAVQTREAQRAAPKMASRP